MIKISLVMIAALVLASAPAHAARFTGAYLLKLCQMDASGKETVPGGHTACQAYISAVLDYHIFLKSMKLAPELDICVPDGATAPDLHLSVLRYLEANKQHDSFVAAPAVTMALYANYPCKKRK